MGRRELSDDAYKYWVDEGLNGSNCDLKFTWTNKRKASKKVKQQTSTKLRSKEISMANSERYRCASLIDDNFEK